VDDDAVSEGIQEINKKSKKAVNEYEAGHY
jgi:hypothetical protein